jgi:hypothetical protein
MNVGDRAPRSGSSRFLPLISPLLCDGCCCLTTENGYDQIYCDAFVNTLTVEHSPNGVLPCCSEARDAWKIRFRTLQSFLRARKLAAKADDSIDQSKFQEARPIPALRYWPPRPQRSNFRLLVTCFANAYVNLTGLPGRRGTKQTSMIGFTDRSHETILFSPPYR